MPEYSAVAGILHSEEDYRELARDHARLQLSYDSAIKLVRSLSDNPPLNTVTSRSGRTTRLILRAMIAVSEGHRVAIVAASFHHAVSLRTKIIERCRSWHIPMIPTDLVAMVVNDNREGFAGVVLIDHYAIEKMEKC